MSKAQLTKFIRRNAHIDKLDEKNKMIIVITEQLRKANNKSFCADIMGLAYVEDIKNLKAQNKKLIKCLELINDIAPPMYKYNNIELEIILRCRQCLSDIKEQ